MHLVAAISLEDRFSSTNTGPQTAGESSQRQLDYIQRQHDTL